MHRPDFDGFFDGLAYRLEIFRSAKKRLNRYLAGDFNVFDYIQQDEIRLSRIISDLLRPDGSHGQGDAFLVEFLTAYNIPVKNSSIEKVRVRCEADTGNGRIDILIDIDMGNKKRFGLAIENKPWANDQKNQVDRYLDYLDKECQSNKEYLCLIYLTPFGTEPSTFSTQNAKKALSEGHLKLAAYAGDAPSISAWLKTCYQKCEAEKVRWFLMDFMNFIASEFPISGMTDPLDDEKQSQPQDGATDGYK